MLLKGTKAEPHIAEIREYTDTKTLKKRAVHEMNGEVEKRTLYDLNNAHAYFFTVGAGK